MPSANPPNTAPQMIRFFFMSGTILQTYEKKTVFRRARLKKDASLLADGLGAVHHRGEHEHVAGDFLDGPRIGGFKDLQAFYTDEAVKAFRFASRQEVSQQESFFNQRYFWVNSKFTPRETMRGKMALLGYLYGIR